MTIFHLILFFAVEIFKKLFHILLLNLHNRRRFTEEYYTVYVQYSRTLRLPISTLSILNLKIKFYLNFSFEQKIIIRIPISDRTVNSYNELG